MQSPLDTRLHQARFLRLALVLVFCCLANACGTVTPAAQAPTLTPLALQLAWMPTAEYAPFYVAQQQGYYKAEQIDMTFLPRGEQPATELVAAGKAQFGIASADRILLARDAGQPLVAIATLYQRCPIVYISLAERNITKPQDLIGKIVEVDTSGTTGIVYRAFLKSQEIKPEQVTMRVQPDVTNDALRLVNGEVDVIDGFFNAQPLQVTQMGKQTNLIFVSDYGIDIYPNTIFTTESMIKEHPDQVTQFLRATLKGIDAAIANPEAAAESVIAVDKTQNLGVEQQTMQLALPMFKPTGSVVGMMTDENWRLTYQMLVDQQMLKNPIAVNTAYDLSFLKVIYGT